MLVAALVTLVSSCGGKSESHGEHAARLHRVSSAEAATAIRAALPEGARFLELRANSSGTLNAEGTDTRWIAWTQDDESRQGFFASASPDGRSIQVTLEARDYNEECLGSDLVELDSAFAVPDALERVDGLHLETAEIVWLYYWQQAGCLAENTAFAPTGHLVQTTRKGPDWQHFIFAHYDDSGEVVRLCGPCDSGLHENCAVCAP